MKTTQKKSKIDTQINKKHIKDSKLKRELLTLALLIACDASASQLNSGNNSIPIPISGSKSQTYTISGHGQKKLTMQVPKNLDIDMYVRLTLPNGSTKTLCKPFNARSKDEACYLNLEAGSFTMYIKNESEISTNINTVNVELEDYTCLPSLDILPPYLNVSYNVCPVSAAIEKSDSYSKSWKSSYSSSSPSVTHTAVDKYAKDINWSSGNNDLNLPLFAPISGEVIFVGRSRKEDSASAYAYGNQVIIYNPYSRIAARLTHLNETLPQMSTWVSIGSYIGKMGSTGNSVYSHLHLVLYHNIEGSTLALSNLKKGIFPNGKTLSNGNHEKYALPFEFWSDFRMPRVNEG